MLNNLKITIVSEIENEIICAAKKGGELILLYVVVGSDGKHDIKVRCNKGELNQGVIKDLKEAAKTVF